MENKTSTTIGTAIRLARRMTGLTQEELAERAGCSRATISYVENDRRGITFTMLESIAKAIDISTVLLVYMTKVGAEEVSDMEAALSHELSWQGEMTSNNTSNEEKVAALRAELEDVIRERIARFERETGALIHEASAYASRRYCYEGDKVRTYMTCHVGVEPLPSSDELEKLLIGDDTEG